MFLSHKWWLLAAILILPLASCKEMPVTEAASGNTPIVKGTLLYSNALSSSAQLRDWEMEGPGVIEFNNDWMQMYSPDEAMHHVLWCPEVFPDSFIAEWQGQSLKTDAGLVIVFFAAKGVNGESIFDPSLPPRDGTFTDYTEGTIRSYHISYYTNAAHNPDRGHANLRKNNTFSLLQEGEEGIPTLSTDIHTIRLVKQKAHITLFVDDRLVIDYTDNQPLINGVNTGDALTNGRIGFRQMKWTRFQYRNFKVWSIK